MYRDRCYLVVTTPRTWQQAANECAARSVRFVNRVQLASVRDHQDNGKKKVDYLSVMSRFIDFVDLVLMNLL